MPLFESSEEDILENKKFTQKDEISECPGCQSGQLQKIEQATKIGAPPTVKVVCNKCGLGFLQEQDRFKLIQLADGTSIRLLKCLNNSFSLEQWKQIAGGASLHYEAKSGSYVPLVSKGVNETVPDQNKQLSRVPPSTIPYSNARSTVGDSVADSQDKRCGITPEADAKDHSNESQPTMYVLTPSGKYFLNMSFDNMMEINHLLRCVKEKMELPPGKLKILIDAGLLADR